MYIYGEGAPTVSTFGSIGDYYIDTKSETMYKCVDIITADIKHQFVSIDDRDLNEVQYKWDRMGKTKISDCSEFFMNGKRLSNLEQIDTSNSISFYRTFYGCSALTIAPVLNTSNGTDFSGMFYNCWNLTDVPVLDTSNGTNFGNMFYGCNKLTTIPELDTSNGTSFVYMFNGCNAIEYIPELDTSKGTEFYYMFNGCRALKAIPELNTSNGTTFNYMFYGCNNLTTIPELDTSNGTNFTSMFQFCGNLTSIPKLDLSNNTSSLGGIVSSCFKLTDLYLYNIRKTIQIGSGTSWGHLLTIDSLVHTIKELCYVSSSQKLTMGSANLEKIANLYCRVLDNTTEKIEMELCEPTDEGAMTLAEYAALKNWTFA